MFEGILIQEMMCECHRRIEFRMPAIYTQGCCLGTCSNSPRLSDSLSCQHIKSTHRLHRAATLIHAEPGASKSGVEMDTSDEATGSFTYESRKSEMLQE